MLLPAPTIVELFCLRVEADAKSPALGIKRDGQYRWLTWDEVAQQVAQATAALVELGVQPGEAVVQVSENRAEWVIADLAIQMAGAVHVPIHPTLAGPQIAWQIRHCEAKVVLLSGPEQAAKLRACGAVLPPHVRWLSYDACSESLGDQEVASWHKLAAAADTNCGQDTACRTRQSVQASDLATILYTSGTTGEPKGVMLSQGNLASNACATLAAFGDEPPQLRLNFLPLSHIFARTCDLYVWLAEGSRLALAQSRETVLADCALVRPTSLNGVPYFYDKVYRGLCAKGVQDQPGIISTALGGEIRKCCAGGAALPDHLYEYYLQQGVPILQGYGLSESSPVITVSTPAHFRRGSCGRPIPGIEVRLAADGEILSRGPHIMQGYFKNPTATADVLTDGWLATGDLGRLDDEGFLYITGRKKEILVTSGGKNIAPVFLESLLTEDPLIAQAMVLGDGRSYLTALIVPNFDALQPELEQRGLAQLAREVALVHPDLITLFASRIHHRLTCVSPHEQVRKFCLIAQAFAIESGELTPKLSLRRQPIMARYAREIELLYSASGCENQSGIAADQ